MKLLLKFGLAIICILIVAFCTFGFLATFEQGAPGAMFFRWAYGGVGLGCIGSIISLVASALRPSSD